MSDQQIIRVLVVDDNALLRRGLSETISIEPDFEVVGSAVSGEEAIDLYDTLRPDVVSMDYQMPGMDGVECTRAILSKYPEAMIILLSIFDSEEDIWKAVQAGVRGYLTKKTGEVSVILDALREVAEGNQYFPAKLAAKLERRSQGEDLTDREVEVLESLAGGMSNQEISDHLDLSLPTVKFHVVNIRNKLGAADRTDAVVKGLKRGVIRIEDD
ncbi:MAG: response regulator transcription factor [Verrucomicrobiota bacterium]